MKELALLMFFCIAIVASGFEVRQGPDSLDIDSEGKYLITFANGTQASGNLNISALLASTESERMIFNEVMANYDSGSALVEVYNFGPPRKIETGYGRMAVPRGRTVIQMKVSFHNGFGTINLADAQSGELFDTISIQDHHPWWATYQRSPDLYGGWKYKMPSLGFANQ